MGYHKSGPDPISCVYTSVKCDFSNTAWNECQAKVLFLSSHWASPVMDHRAGEAANSSFLLGLC